MYILGSTNSSSQTVLSNGIINMGSTYRRYCKKNSCGTPVFTNNGTSLSLNQEGIYHVTVVAIASGTEAGDVTIQLYRNGDAVGGATSTESVGVADTELHSLVIDYYFIVDSTCVLGVSSVQPAIITLVNTGVGATFSQVTVNIDKVL